VQKSSVLVAKVKELTEAYQSALRRGKQDEADFWNVELLHHLWRLSASISSRTGDRPANTGE
jgi:hypothetical protein